MRTYNPDYTDFGISRDRYRELLAFCRQYQEWQAEARSLLGVSAQSYEQMPHGNEVGDPVYKVMLKREKLLAKIGVVEEVADEVDGGRWRAALIQNVCMGRALKFIDPAILPTSRRNSFFQQRRAFFILLDKRIDKIRYSRGDTSEI